MRVASRVELSIWGTIHGLARLTSNMQGLNLVILSPFECNFMWANPFNPQLRYMSLWIKLFENFEILTFGFFFSIFTLSLIRYFSSPNLAIIDTFFYHKFTTFTDLHFVGDTHCNHKTKPTHWPIILSYVVFGLEDKIRKNKK